MVEPWEQWDRAMDPRPERRPSRRRGPMPVNSRWLRRIFPLTEDVEESMQALKLVSEAGLNESKPIDASSAEGGEGGTEGGPRSWQKLQVSWAKLLKQAHRKCAGAVMTELGPVKLEPIYPDVQVQEEFLSAQKKYQGVTTYTYHGTKQGNIRSIAHQGLLLPGVGGHTVKNGSTHGLGVYTARLGSAGLSKAFCDSDQMFLCGVCDPSLPVEEMDAMWEPSSTMVQTHFPRRPVVPRGGRATTRHALRQSCDEVIHVGDAVVSFKQNLVVPLFLISGNGSEMERAGSFRLVLKHHAWISEEEDVEWAPPQQVATRQLALPESGKLVKFGHCGSGRTVWLVQDPWSSANPKERSLKRRRLARERDRMLKWARDHKRLIRLEQ
ncbi:unnamed protein product [Durusdinium trenchii]|uniref:PARP catalytic domain-containing protein n=1 Tax=Durusdinium trenchii TaxID=1381693 RepID=A0ABP0MM00_9DINO